MFVAHRPCSTNMTCNIAPLSTASQIEKGALSEQNGHLIWGSGPHPSALPETSPPILSCQRIRSLPPPTRYHFSQCYLNSAFHIYNRLFLIISHIHLIHLLFNSPKHDNRYHHPSLSRSCNKAPQRTSHQSHKYSWNTSCRYLGLHSLLFRRNHYPNEYATYPRLAKLHSSQSRRWVVQ